MSAKEQIEGLLSRARTPEKRADYEKELDLPPLPWCLTYLWSRFIRLSNRRGNNGFGLSLLTFAEIEAYQRLSGFRFTPWEFEMIEMLDHIYVAAMSDAMKDGA